MTNEENGWDADKKKLIMDRVTVRRKRLELATAMYILIQGWILIGTSHACELKGQPFITLGCS